MVRSELLQKMRNLHPNILSRDMEKIFEIIFLEFTKALCKGENIEIRGFGTFKIKKQRARIGRNPKDGSRIEIPAKNTIQWKMSKQLFKLLNNESNNNK